MRTPVNLFCFPFAGGSKYSYNDFEKVFSPDIRVRTLDYPGRGARMREPLQKNMSDLVNDMFNQVKQLLHQPYAFFGHSMGGLVCYLVTQKILKENMHPPLYIFVSGTSGPSCKELDPPYYNLGKIQFKEVLRDLGGVPHELLENAELFEFFEPILRADLQAIDEYQYIDSPPLNIPLTVLRGIDEKITMEQAMNWQKETTFPIHYVEIPGNHFFIFDHSKAIARIAESRLLADNLSLQQRQ